MIEKLKPHFDDAFITVYENEKFNAIDVVGCDKHRASAGIVIKAITLVIIDGHAHILDIMFMKGLLK